MSIFEDPEQRPNRKIARSGAYALGGGVGCWFLGFIYPHEESANTIASVFSSIGTLLIIYGVITLASVIFKRKLAIPINFLMIWLVVPAGILYIFTTFWGASPIPTTPAQASSQLENSEFESTPESP